MNTENDQHFMQHALLLAKKAQDQNEVPVGAVIVLDNKIIGEGWNQPIQSNDPTAHAEIIAIRSAAKNIHNYRLVNSILYVTLEPCLMCIGAIMHARIKKLIFGASDPKVGAASLLKHTESQGGVCEAECATMLKDFFKLKR